METICKDKKMAISILQAIALHLKAGTMRSAIEAVMQWIEQAVDEIPEDVEERKALIAQIEEELFLCASPEERRAMLSRICKIDDGELFSVVALPPGSDSMLRDNEGGTNDRNYL